MCIASDTLINIWVSQTAWSSGAVVLNWAGDRPDVRLCTDTVDTVLYAAVQGLTAQIRWTGLWDAFIHLDALNQGTTDTKVWTSYEE